MSVMGQETTAVASRRGPSGRDSWTRLGLIVGGLVAAVGVMLALFVAPALHSGADDLPLAVSGSTSAVRELTTTLNERSPGTFEVSTYASADEVSSAVSNRDAIGGVSLDGDKATIVTASGAGTPYTTALHTLGNQMSAAGVDVTYDDVAPLTTNDPAGVAIAALGLPLAFGGMISALVLSTQFKRRPGRRVLGVLGFAAVAGFGVAGLLQYGFGVIDGNYWVTATANSLGIAAISMTITGLESLFGFAGLGIGAVLMMFISNPLSGLSTGWQWLPHPWGSIGQLLPLGATGTAVRSAAYFDGNGIGRSLMVLVVWLGIGLILVALAAERRRAAAAATEASALEPSPAPLPQALVPAMARTASPVTERATQYPSIATADTAVLPATA